MRAIGKLALVGLSLTLCQTGVPKQAVAEEAVPSVPLALTCILPEKQAPYEYRLTDQLTATRVSLRADESASFSFDEAPQGLVVKWYEVPTQYTVRQYDIDAVLLSEETAATGSLNRYHALSADCRSVTIDSDEAVAISEIAVYGQGALPADVQQWEPTEEKVDLLIVAAQPGAELSQFAGLLPAYAVERDIATAVVYMTDCGRRARAEEALTGLWGIGIKNEPVFAGFISDNNDLEFVVETMWEKDATVGYLTELIGSLNPKVVVTHAPMGEGILSTHAFTGKCVTEAVAAAAEQGLWQVDKLYLNGESADATRLNQELPLAAYGGRTAYGVAKEAYRAHVSQQLYWPTLSDAGYTLAATTVGEDVQKDDLFEHIDTAALIRHAAPTIAPTATPAPVEATAVPTVQPAPTPIAALPFAKGMDMQRLALGILIVGLLMSAALLLIFRKHLRKPWSVCALLLPCMAGVVLFLLLGGMPPKMENAAAAQGPLPSEAVLPTDTPAPTDTPKPTDTPTPAPAETAYVPPFEEVTFDTEHGYWAYRSPLLSVSVQRIYAENRGDPLCYFVADIVAADAYQLRPAFGSDAHTGGRAEYPWDIARTSRAVLLITGDNMIRSDTGQKGVIIRDGRLFLNNDQEDTLAVYPDMSLRIEKKWNQNATRMLEDGVENSFSFGPTLVIDGKVNPNAYKHRVNPRNPRAGLGMVEPGHYVAIVVDGRQKEYSIGLNMTDFAALFTEYGCQVAYNMDGGLSACMVFMGMQLNNHDALGLRDAGESAEQRKISDGVMFGYSELVPTAEEMEALED